jgi:hypothetical protein
MLGDPLEFFERVARSRYESPGPIRDLQIDKLLGFSDSENARLLTALADFYPAGHWTSDRTNFSHSIEKAIQLLSAGLCSLKNRGFVNHDPLECCARIVQSPKLSPFVVKDTFNYVIVPVGFLSSIEKFISSTYAIATVAASGADPTGNSVVWDEDMLLGSIAILADTNIFTFTRGVMEASSEGAMQQVVDEFSDSIVFSVFDREIQKGMMEMMPSASSWERLGYHDLSDALVRYPKIRKCARTIARLSVCFTICHEFGHVFSLAIKSDGAEELAADETLADMMGIQVLYRLSEAKILPAIVDAAVTSRDLGHALAAFHSWNLSIQLAGLLRPMEHVDIEDMSARVNAVAKRWESAMTLIDKVWTDEVPVLAHLKEKVSTGKMITNHWGVMTAGMLRIALLYKGHNIDMESACKILPLLSNRDSKLYTLLDHEG